MAGKGIDLGNLPIYVSKDNYLLFFNQQEKQETTKNRAVLKTDYQRFIWAFVLGIRLGTRIPLGKNRESSFKWQYIPQETRALIIGLTLQEMYGDNPEKIKEDVNDSDGNNTFNEHLRQAIEEYANAGFSVIRQRALIDPTYIENFEAVVHDILFDEPPFSASST